MPIDRDHPNARLAAHAAEEVFSEKGAQAFYEMRAELLREDLSPDKVLQIARRHGADPARLSEALAGGRHAETLERDRKLLVRMDKSGTPEFFINGRNIGGARPYETFAQVVEDEIKRAGDLLRAGVPADRLFSTIIAHGVDHVEHQRPRPGEPIRVHIRLINVCFDGHGATPQSRTRDEAHALVSQMRRTILSGGDFAALAKQYSNAGNAHIGGEFGWLSRGTLVPDIDSAALKLHVGETSQPVEGDGCFTLVQRIE
jgi:hypothetical protein